MNQQINLYQPMFHRQRAVFAARSMARGLLVAALGLLAVYAYPAWQVQVLERETRGLDAQREAALARLTELEAAVPAREPSKILAAEVERLTGEVARRDELLEALSRRVDGASAGFSGYLEGLARQRVEGLWLTELAIREGGGRLEIGGRSTSPELVPVLVQRLARESVFSGSSFGYLSLDGDEDGLPVGFRLRTRQPEEALR